jgi:hypothetical protein
MCLMLRGSRNGKRTTGQKKDIYKAKPLVNQLIYGRDMLARSLGSRILGVITHANPTPHSELSRSHGSVCIAPMLFGFTAASLLVIHLKMDFCLSLSIPLSCIYHRNNNDDDDNDDDDERKAAMDMCTHYSWRLFRYWRPLMLSNQPAHMDKGWQNPRLLWRNAVGTLYTAQQELSTSRHCNQLNWEGASPTA